MKLSRFNSIFNGLNGTARKVYEVVPMRSHWSQHKIMMELERLGKHLDPVTVKGCLGHMLSVGIIEQNAEGDFVRTQLKIATRAPDDHPIITTHVKEKDKMAVATVETKEKPVQSSVADALAVLAKRCQTIADMVDDLKEDIEKVALQSIHESEQKDRDMAKFKQLKQLLGSLQD